MRVLPPLSFMIGQPKNLSPSLIYPSDTLVISYKEKHCLGSANVIIFPAVLGTYN